jgi:hypothetical protein
MGLKIRFLTQAYQKNSVRIGEPTLLRREKEKKKKMDLRVKIYKMEEYEKFFLR